MRYAMRFSPAFRPLLALFGGTAAQSYVELGADSLRFRFGWGFDETVPHAEIGSARRRDWSLIGGIGWRLSPGQVALVGSREGVVEVRLRQQLRVRAMLIPVRVERIIVSLEEPDAFLTSLGEGQR